MEVGIDGGDVASWNGNQPFFEVFNSPSLGSRFTSSVKCKERTKMPLLFTNPLLKTFILLLLIYSCNNV